MKFFVHVTCGSGYVMLCYAICYALPVGFAYDVMSSDNEAYAKFVLDQAQFREIKKRMGESCYPRLPR